MSLLDNIILNLPEVESPKQKRLPFNDRLKWTLIVLVLFFILGLIPLWGLAENNLEQFNQLSIILGAEFGSLLSLGIGPIVTGSIILQLLNGAGILKFDLTTHEGKQRYQGVQKLTSLFFVIFEAFIYVFLGGLSTGAFFNPSNGIFLTGPVAGAIAFSTTTVLYLKLFLAFQLFLGGIVILMMDEIVSKWGFGSGISLFIAAGISKQIFIQLFSFTDANGFFFWESGFQIEAIIGHVWRILVFLSKAEFTPVVASIIAILATIIVFAIAVYAQAMKVEIPLSFGRVRGHGIRWPLQFIYTSNIPVILVASLFATLQLWVRLLQNWTGGNPLPILGGYFVDATGAVTSTPVGLIAVLTGPNLVQTIIQSRAEWTIVAPVLLNSIIYVLLMIGGAVLFSIFWVQTAGMSSKNLADQMLSSGLQIPGFRKDRRILERLLDRYIFPLTVMGGITVGFLAAIADLLGALSRGTGILLTVMIVYKLYEDIAREHMYDMNPLLRKFMGK